MQAVKHTTNVITQKKSCHKLLYYFMIVLSQIKDLKRQLQQMQKREEKLQEQLAALRGGNAGAIVCTCTCAKALGCMLTYA